MKKKWFIVISLITILIGFIYIANNQIVVDGSFSRNSQVVHKQELPELLKIDVTVIPFGTNNAIVFGYLEISGQKEKFRIRGFYDRSKEFESDWLRLTCVNRQKSDSMIDRYVNIKLKDFDVEELELIEAITYYDSSRTESEVGTYLPQ